MHSIINRQADQDGHKSYGEDIQMPNRQCREGQGVGVFVQVAAEDPGRGGGFRGSTTARGAGARTHRSAGGLRGG